MNALIRLILIEDGHAHNIVLVVLVHVAELVGRDVFDFDLALLDHDLVVGLAGQRTFL